MKECFRNWVLTHEKLYKLIVFVLALVAFLAVTAHGCKTMKAEAATDVSRELINYAISLNRGIDNIVILQDSVGNYYTMVETLKDDEAYLNGNFIVTSHNSCSPILVTPNWWLHKWYRITENRTSEEVSFSHSACTGTHILEYGLQFVYATKPVLAMGGVQGNDNGYYFDSTLNSEPVPVYSSAAPYVLGDNLNLQNLYLQGVLPYGEALKKSYMELECNMLGAYQNYNDFTVRGILSVNLPTREFFEAFVKGLSTSGNYDFDDIDTVVLTSKAAIEYVKAWRSQTKNCVTYHLPFEYTYSLDEIVDGKLFIKFNARQVFDAIEQDSGYTLRSMYCPGDITDLQYTVIFEPLMSGFLDYFELGAYTVSYNDIESVYGKYVAHAFGGPDNTIITTYVSDLDVENTPSDEFVEGVQGGLGDATQEYVENLEATIKDLQGRLEQINNDLAAMEGGLDGSALWNGFNSVVVGIRSVGDSVRGVAVVIGNVFSFIPAPITAIMSFTLVAMCIIGIYKALKG